MAYGVFFEAFVLLFMVPLGLVLAPTRPLLLPILLLGALYTGWRCRGRVDFKKAFARPQQGWWKQALRRSVLVAIFSALFCLYFQPELFLNFPRHRPTIWIMVVCLYPVLSVFPQEIIYRLYFFEVVAAGKEAKWRKLCAGTMLFCWVHIIYHNAFALWGTLFAGGVFNWIYWKYRDEPGVMWRVLLEHSLYGLIIFTVGLGGFFFLAR